MIGVVGSPGTGGMAQRRPERAGRRTQRLERRTQLEAIASDLPSVMSRVPRARQLAAASSAANGRPWREADANKALEFATKFQTASHVAKFRSAARRVHDAARGFAAPEARAFVDLAGVLRGRLDPRIAAASSAPGTGPPSTWRPPVAEQQPAGSRRVVRLVQRREDLVEG